VSTITFIYKHCHIYLDTKDFIAVIFMSCQLHPCCVFLDRMGVGHSDQHVKGAESSAERRHSGRGNQGRRQLEGTGIGEMLTHLWKHLQ